MKKPRRYRELACPECGHWNRKGRSDATSCKNCFALFSSNHEPQRIVDPVAQAMQDEVDRLKAHCNVFVTALIACLKQMETDAESLDREGNYRSIYELWEDGDMPEAAKNARMLIQQATGQPWDMSHE